MKLTDSVHWFYSTGWNCWGFQRVRPAEGVQTLSEYSTLSWLNGGEADGTGIFCNVLDKVLFFCCQEFLVFPLALLLLSLDNTETTRVSVREKESSATLLSWLVTWWSWRSRGCGVVYIEPWLEEGLREWGALCSHQPYNTTFWHFTDIYILLWNLIIMHVKTFHPHE